MNHLEELVKEYYEYRGYFVKTNVKLEKLAHGGRKGEIDILAYKQKNGELVHVECSLAAASTSDLIEVAEKKFRNDFTVDFYTKLLDLSPEAVKTVRKKFIAGLGYRTTLKGLPGGVEHESVPKFVRSVLASIPRDFMKDAVPESLPLLRTLQLALWSKELENAEPSHG